LLILFSILINDLYMCEIVEVCTYAILNYDW
jgi:hypothetical protein